MKLGTYMILGASVGLGLICISVLMPDVISTAGMGIFAAGALFGKGYGIWEERTRRSSRS